MKFVITFLITNIFILQLMASTATKCAICGMSINENSRNQIILKHSDSGKDPMHVDALSCAGKVQQYDSKYNSARVVDFNQTDKFIDGKDMFFLINSKTIKSAIGSHAMSPYYGAFKSMAEAQAAMKKYVGGVIVKGINQAIKTR